MTTSTKNNIQEALKAKKKGFHIGHRLILPFKCQLLKIIIEGHIYTEMVGSDNIKIHQDARHISIYFRSIGNLSNTISDYEVIKIIAAEWDADLCDIKNHIKLICEIKENHTVNIHVPSDDMLFIE